jgi:hypothetical protein
MQELDVSTSKQVYESKFTMKGLHWNSRLLLSDIKETGWVLMSKNFMHTKMTGRCIKRGVMIAYVVVQMLVSTALAQTLAPEVLLGRDWLQAQVNAEGTITNDANGMATDRQTRAEVLETLQRFNVAPSALINKVRAESSDQAVEHLARQIIASARTGAFSTTKLAELKAFQNADGGFGGSTKFGSNSLDTAFALIALRATNQLSGTEISRALDFLNVKGDDVGGFSASTASKPYLSAYVLLALQSYGAQFQIAASIDQAKLRLSGQLQNGGYSETVLDAVGAIALGFSSSTDPNLTSLKAKIRNAQQSNGSWGNDAFLTALALRALSTTIETPPPTTGELSLLVRDAQTLAPLAGATLVLSPNPQFTGTSSAAGAISIIQAGPSDWHRTVCARRNFQHRVARIAIGWHDHCGNVAHHLLGFVTDHRVKHQTHG